MRRNIIRDGLLSLSLLLVFNGGCSSSSSEGGNANDQPLPKGYFIDSPVKGLKYVNGSRTGTTDSDGSFPYSKGEVEFFIGKISLGKISQLSSDNQVFIQDIVGVDRSVVDNEKVLQLATFLQSLDSDEQTNEIEITQEVFNKFNQYEKSFSTDTIDVEEILKKQGITPRPKEKVKKHLENSLKKYKLVSDHEKPTVLRSEPADNSKEISTRDKIIIYFSEGLDDKTIKKFGNVVLKDRGDNLANINTYFTNHENALVISLKESLKNNMEYRLVLSKDIADFHGNNLGEEKIFTYVTVSKGTIRHKGDIYKVIQSPITNKLWLDRNLGAKKACDESIVNYQNYPTDPLSNDVVAKYGASQSQCFGDYYQWGRKSNGHEKLDSEVTTTLIDEDSESYDKFIKVRDLPQNWSNIKNDNLWKGLDGVNNPCPDGFRVPTAEELENETYKAPEESNNRVKNLKTAFENFLKFPANGNRWGRDGTMFYTLESGVWTSDVKNDTAKVITFATTATYEANIYNRSWGFGVRCIKETDSVEDLLDDVNPPKIVSTNPSGYSKNILLDSTVSFTFNEELKEESVNKSNITFKTKGDKNVDFDIEYTKETKTLLLTPKADLDSKTEYVVTITSNVKDLFGNGSERTLHFTTVTDNPYIVSVDPENNSEKIPTDKVIAITFSEPVQNYESSILLSNGSSNLTPIFNLSGSVLSITATLAENTSYTLTLKTTVKDLDDKPLEEETVIKFSTVDTQPPTLLNSLPSGAISMLPTTGYLSMEFSESLKESTVNSTNIVLKDSSDSTVVTNIQMVENTAIINPLSTLTDGESYTLSLKAGLEDLGDNSFGGHDISFTAFDTASETKATISFQSKEYKVITSPITGKSWLDRNLGAEKVCIKGEAYSERKKCIGGFYQWGRKSNGHEFKHSDNDFTRSKVDSDVDNGGVFIYHDLTEQWRNTQSDSLWKGVNGPNNPCPSGFRVPTIYELEDETYDPNHKFFTESANELKGIKKVKSRTEAIDNFLQLPNDGTGYYFGTRADGTVIALYSSTPYTTSTTKGYYLKLGKTYSRSDRNKNTGYAMPVRCIKD
ncbi:MAG: Ig-like domain-containing protein [Campylobacterales bacterium]|nr:Ig-like domain-containing protein [Campylobacterales bacterium]